MPQPLDIRCPGCRRAVPVAQINIQALVARCPDCDQVFSFADLVPRAAKRPVRTAGEKPKRIEVEDYGTRKVLRRRWFTWAVLVMVPFCLFWNGIVSVFVVTGVTQIIQGHAMGWVALLCPGLHIAVGVGLAYWTLAMFLNKTIIEVAPDSFQIRHGPLPWKGVKPMDPAQIEQIWVHEKIGSKGSRSWYLKAKLIDGKELTLLGSLNSMAEGEWLEITLEDWLGIEDDGRRGSEHYTESDSD